MPSQVISDRLLAVLPEDLRPQAAERLQSSEPVLRRLLAGLYGDHADFNAWLGDLMESLGKLYAERSPELRALDLQRIAQPDWFLSQRMLGYCAYAQNFGGSLNGVAERIPYLEELGVSYLHLLPFLRPREGENDGGFAVTSFDEVDPALGTNADLHTLTTRLRGAGISLCSDFILNHVADDNHWALAAKAGDAKARAMFHVFPDRDMPDRHERTLGQVFPQVAPGNFTYVESMGGWVWTTFYPYQWDMNWSNPDVFAEMAAAMLRLANRGIEVFRLDSTAFLWKREGTNSMNQPEAHQILQALRAIVDIVAPGVLLKAEAIVPTRELPAYLGSSAAPECHIAYHSSLMAAGWVALAEQNTGVLREVIRNTPALPSAATWLSYVRCHDDIGWNVLRAEAEAGSSGGSAARLASVARFFSGAEGSYARGAAFQSTDPNAAHGSNGMAASLTGLQTAASEEARALALRRMQLLHGLALSFGALPVLYMGDELAMENDYTYLDRPEHAMDSRWLQRPAFDEQRWTLRYDKSSAPGIMFQGLANLIRVRRHQDALAANAPRTLLADAPNGLLALARGDKFLTLMNFTGQHLEYTLQGVWSDCAAPGRVEGIVTLAPYAMHWLARELYRIAREGVETGMETGMETGTQQQTIAVFGEALVDDFFNEQIVGGAPFNVARNLAAFGVATLMVTRIGDDNNGALMRAEFERFGMSSAGLQIDPTKATGRVVVERNEQGHRFIILPDQAYDYVEAAPALAALVDAKPAVIYFGTLAQRHARSRAALRAMLQASDITRYLDLNVREGQVTERCAFESLHLADIVKVNEDELKDLFSWYTHTKPGTKAIDSPEMVEACQALMRIFSLKGLIVTLGERGALYFDADGTVTANQECHAPARIVDTVGAGDAFSAVFLFGQSQGWSLPLVLARANAFAGAICGISGAVPADIAFYQPWIACWRSGGVLPTKAGAVV